MNLYHEKALIDTIYYEQIKKAVSKNIPQEELQDIINDYTQLQLIIQKRSIEPKDIDTLSDLVALLESEVNKYNG